MNDDKILAADYVKFGIKKLDSQIYLVKKYFKLNDFFQVKHNGKIYKNKFQNKCYRGYICPYGKIQTKSFVNSTACLKKINPFDKNDYEDDHISYVFYSSNVLFDNTLNSSYNYIENTQKSFGSFQILNYNSLVKYSVIKDFLQYF